MCVEGVHFIVNFIICFSLEILSINERRKFIKGKKDYRRHSLIVPLYLYLFSLPWVHIFERNFSLIGQVLHTWNMYDMVWLSVHVRHNLARLQNIKAFIEFCQWFFQIFFTPYDKSLSFLEQSKKTLGKCNTLYSINCRWTCNRYDKEGWVAVKQLLSVQF